jgi:LAS superfamily LD-carboxypeptidase LdcB
LAGTTLECLENQGGGELHQAVSEGLALWTALEPSKLNRKFKTLATFGLCRSVMTPFRRIEDESCVFSDPRLNPGQQSEPRLGPGLFGNPVLRRRQWDRNFSSELWSGLRKTSFLEYEGEPTEATVWTNSAEQQAFREQVLNAHLARSKSRKGLPQPDLSNRQLAPVHGTSVAMRADSAEAANRLFEAANADLAKARAAGHADALRTIRLTANSGYRGSEYQRNLWLDYFKNYYNQTRRARAGISDGPHSAKAMSYMLYAFRLPNRIAAPGYSNHQAGIAIDFEQKRAKGYEISNSYETKEQNKWRATWFFDWLQNNAARFGFRQYIKEAWHWEYRPSAPGAEISRADGHSEAFQFESEQPARSFLGGFVHTFTSKSLAVTISVFCPRAARSRQSVEVLVYAHGLLNPCPPVPKRLPEGFITAAPFKLGEIVDASSRGIVLVVPFFDWKPRQTHALGRPANLNTLVDEVLAEVGAMQSSAPPSLSNLILSGHSRAYDFLEPLAQSYTDPQMRRGALAKLSEVWMFDTTYACQIPAWMGWLTSKPNLQVSVFFRENSGTASCGWKLYATTKQSGGRLRVTPLNPYKIVHCSVPTSLLGGLLNRSPDDRDPHGRSLNRARP